MNGALKVLTGTLADSRVLPGAGCWEVHLAAHLRGPWTSKHVKDGVGFKLIVAFRCAHSARADELASESAAPLDIPFRAVRAHTARE